MQTQRQDFKASMPPASLFQMPLHRRQWAHACAGLLGAIVGAAPGLAAPSPTTETLQWPARLELLDAPALSADSLNASPTVLVFFSMDCAYCRRHNQRLSRLAQQQPKGLRVLGAALDTDAEALRRYRDAQGLRFAITPGAEALRERVTPRRVIPFTAVVAQGGTFLERIPGEMSEADILGLARWATTGV